ncbi:alpha/beta hydrolase [Marinicella sp. W31]|uniref:alpha/beta hydrolase n=1 Tax=Marinicella sp. W31 TaxID=3023713 RepID=UPI003757C793
MKMYVLLCLFLIANQETKAEAVDEKNQEMRKLSLKMSSLEDVFTTELTSEFNQHLYQIFIRLPANMDKAKKYPTVYLLDGDITFPLIAAYQKYLELSEEIPEVILVGIAYGTDDWRKGNHRSVDFTAPSETASHYGGADDFRRMIKEELMPVMENNYPIDKQKQIVFGHSLGGQFVLLNKFRIDSIFWGGIASNPAIHNNTQFFLDAAEKSINDMPLALLHADNDAAQFKQPRQLLLALLQQKEDVKKIRIIEAQDHHHFSLVPYAYRHGMKYLFAQ